MTPWQKCNFWNLSSKSESSMSKYITATYIFLDTTHFTSYTFMEVLIENSIPTYHIYILNQVFIKCKILHISHLPKRIENDILNTNSTSILVSVYSYHLCKIFFNRFTTEKRPVEFEIGQKTHNITIWKKKKYKPVFVQKVCGRAGEVMQFYRNPL